MRGFRDHDVHKRAMPKLLEWCDEAAVVRFEQASNAVPDAPQILAEMNARGRTSKVRRPTEAHAAGRVVPDQKAPRAGRRLTPR